MALDLSAADKVLKEFYLAPVQEQLNNGVKFLAQLEKNTEDIVGKRAYVPIHVSRNSGVGARVDGGTLPSAGHQGYEDSLVALKHQYGRINVTGPTIRATARDEGAFIRAVDSEMKGVVKDLRRDINRQAFGTSDGVIAGVAAAGGATTTVTLDATTSATQLRQIEKDMVVDIGTVNAPTAGASARTVVSVNRSAKTFVVSGAAVDWLDTWFVFRSGNGGSGASQVEITGLPTQVNSTGSLWDVDPATFDVWASTVDSNGGTKRLLTEDKVQEVSDTVEMESGELPKLWIGSYGVVRSFANQLAAQKRFVNTVELKAGWSGVELAATGGAFAKDRDCPANTAFALTPEKIVEYRMANFDWADYDGRALRNASGQDAWEAFLAIDHEVATSQRNAHAKVTDLTE